MIKEFPLEKQKELIKTTKILQPTYDRLHEQLYGHQKDSSKKIDDSDDMEL